jgi:hypothetical protein
VLLLVPSSRAGQSPAVVGVKSSLTEEPLMLPLTVPRLIVPFGLVASKVPLKDEPDWDNVTRSGKLVLTPETLSRTLPENTPVRSSSLLQAGSVRATKSPARRRHSPARRRIDTSLDESV